MVINTFDLYDILTDIIPGIIGTLFLIILLIPTNIGLKQPQTVLGPGGALLLVAVAYVVGRIIRNINLWWFFNKFQDYLKKNEKSPSPYFISDVDWVFSDPFKIKLNSIFTYQSELDNALVEEAVKILHNKYNLEADYLYIEKLTSEDRKQEDEKLADEMSNERRLVFPSPESVIPVGYSELYDKATLYQRYTIISNFYESISKIFLLTALGFRLSIAGIAIPDFSLWTTTWTNFVEESSVLSASVIAAFVIIGLVSELQHRDLDQKRATAFVSDIVKIREDNQQNP